ncbi:hypothetical protein [Paraburkholderia sp. BL6669N2]|uniref:hypothetical protein n=1 Tax=Paraburkholderia sp. BL6669N2 TaxID=1938807 RepID=UPI000E27A821|nr:hypothetical protein [Paraburkholderia sp. BL6669N2]
MNGCTEISISDLKQVVHTLDAPLGQFFISEGKPRGHVGREVRAGAPRRFGTVRDGLVEEFLSPNVGGAFEMFLGGTSWR